MSDNTTTQQPTGASTKRILHAQVVGTTDQEVLNTVSQVFKDAIDSPESVSIATGTNINVSVFDITADTPIEAVVVRGSITPAFIAETAFGLHAGYRMFRGETNIPTWDDLSEGQQQGAVVAVLRALRSSNLTPKSFHTSWVADMAALGWTYGEQDAAAKTYPTLCPFDELDEPKQMESVIYAYTIAVLRSKLPSPSPDLRRVEIWSIHDECFHEGEFIKLYPGALFRFIDQAGNDQPQQCYQTNSAPYVSYMETGAAWTIDAVAVDTPHHPGAPHVDQGSALPPDEDHIAKIVSKEDE